MILFPSTAMDQAEAVLERVRASCEKDGVLVSGHYITKTVSIGAVEYGGGEESLEDLIEIADQRLYKAKQSGRNQLIVQDA